jgi:AcrR family transcriptional regulator
MKGSEMTYPRFEKLDEEKKQLIMGTALEKFGRNSFDQASLNQISKSAGLSTGALYYYFENKEDLFSSAIQHAMEKFLSRVGDVRERVRTGDYWGEIERLVLARLKLTLEEPESMAMLDRLLRIEDSGESAQVERLFKEQIQKYLRRIFDVGAERGEIRRDLPEDFLFAVHSQLVFVVQQWVARNWDYFDRHSPESEEVKTFVNKAIGLIRAALKP